MNTYMLYPIDLMLARTADLAIGNPLLYNSMDLKLMDLSLRG
jgi:hypothetical protein